MSLQWQLLKKLKLIYFVTTKFLKVLVRLVRIFSFFSCCFLSVSLLIVG